MQELNIIDHAWCSGTQKNIRCKLIEISVPLDNNIAHAYKLKQEKYIKLISQRQRLYRDYKYSVIVITVGCLGAVPDNLTENLLALRIDQDKIVTTIHRIQRAALLGTIKISKTVLNM